MISTAKNFVIAIPGRIESSRLPNKLLLEIDGKLSMNSSKVNALNGSIRISGEEEKERQAYILEDRPRLIKNKLRRYCLY